MQQLGQAGQLKHPKQRLGRRVKMQPDTGLLAELAGQQQDCNSAGVDIRNLTACDAQPGDRNAG